MNEAEFKLKFREKMEEGGHSVDEWDVTMAWYHYQESKKEFDWLYE